MRSQIANAFGVAGGMIAMLAAVAYAHTVTLPYRLSAVQSAFFEIDLVVQFAGSVLAIAFGSGALRGDSRSRRFGFVAIVVGVVTLVLAMLKSHVHSMSPLLA